MAICSYIVVLLPFRGSLSMHVFRLRNDEHFPDGFMVLYQFFLLFVLLPQLIHLQLLLSVGYI